MTFGINTRQTSRVLSTGLDQPQNGLLANLSRAANTPNTGASILNGTGPGAATDSKTAYHDLQQRAAQACFSDAGLRDFVLASAQKDSRHGKDPSAVALLECAVNVLLLEESSISTHQARELKDCLTSLAERFQRRPALSLVTMDLNHPTGYRNYQQVMAQIDKLIQEAPGGADEVFESAQSQVAKEYLVDGLRARVEASWGPLTAQSVRELMHNANFSVAAGKTLDSQLKLAKAGANGRALGEVVRQTLKTLDLHRPGQNAGPAANDPVRQSGPTAPQIQHCLQGCHGHGGGYGNITVHGGSATASNGLTPDVLRELFAALGRSIDGAGVGTSDHSTQTTPPDVRAMESVDRAAQRGPLVRTENVVSDDGSNDGSSEATAQNIALQNERTASWLAQSQRADSDFADDSPTSASNYGIRAQDPSDVVSESNLAVNGQPLNNLIPPPPLLIPADVISQHLRAAPNVSDLQSRNVTSSMEDHLAALRKGNARVKINLKNLPDITPNSVDARIVTRQNISTLSGAIDVGFGAHSDYIQLKRLMQEHTPSWQAIQGNLAFQALRTYNPAFSSRVDRMLAAEGRGFGFSDSNTVHAPQANMTAGRNWHLLNSPRGR